MNSDDQPIDESSSAPTVEDQGIQNNESAPPPPPEPALAPGITPALAPGMEPEPALAPGVAPALAPGVEPALAPGVVPTLAPGVAPTLAPGVAPTLAPGVAPTLASGVAPSKSPTVAVTAPPQTEGFEKTIEQLQASGTSAEKALISGLTSYMKNMAPGKPMDGDVGAAHQNQLWSLLANTINSAPEQEFRKLWSIILAFFNEYKNGVFHDRYIFRFSEYWRYNSDDLAGLQRILNVIKLTADPAERNAGLRQVDLNRSLEFGFTEEGRQRILSYYK